MKKRFFISIFALTLFALFSCSNSTTINTTDTIKTNNVVKNQLKHNVTLIVTSDVHGGVEDNFSLPYIYEKRKEYESKGDYTLLIDDGDLLQGSFLSSMSNGADLIDIANVAKYDIATIGNHEFDYGMENFLKIAKMRDNPYISCNFNKNGKLIFEPYVIKEFDGVKFAFIGICTPETIITSTPDFFQDENGNFIYDFYQGDNGTKLYNKVQEMIDEVLLKGADYVIAVAHIGNKETGAPYRYNDIIANTHGFDVFLDGHSHDTDQVDMKDMNGHSVFRMAVGTKLKNYGVVTFTPAGTIEHQLYTYSNKEEINEPINNVVNDIIKEKDSKIDEYITKKIGETDFPLCIYDPIATDDTGTPIRLVRRMETNLGDFVADAYKIISGADCSMTNSGGIRADIDVGDITIKDVFTVNPFGNSICMIEVTGEKLLDALEWGCSNYPAENGAFPQVSGMTFELDSNVPNPCKKDENGLCDAIVGERRVKNLMINGEAVDRERKYKLALLNYTAFSHGDGYTAFDGCSIIEIDVGVDYIALLDYIKEKLGGKIPERYSNPYGEGRIKIF